MFRMKEELFEELFLLLEPHVRQSYGCAPGHQVLLKRDKVLVTLYFLAHTPTLRAMEVQHMIPNKASMRLAFSAVLPFLPNYRLAHPENYLFLLSKKIFSGSKYPKIILFNFEKGSTAFRWHY